MNFPTPALTPAQEHLMASYARLLAGPITQARVYLDAAHRDGLNIPPQVAEALHTLAALPMAWAANAAGRPAPDDVRQALGLPPVTHDPAQHTIEESMT